LAHIRKAKLLVYRQAERFSNAVRKLFSVPKEAILKGRVEVAASADIQEETR